MLSLLFVIAREVYAADYIHFDYNAIVTHNRCNDFDGNRLLACQKSVEKRLSKEEWLCLEDLMWRESGFRTNAQNPNSTAYGLFQFLTSTFRNYGYEPTDSADIQIDLGFRYIQDRHKTPCGALQHHSQYNYY